MNDVQFSVVDNMSVVIMVECCITASTELCQGVMDPCLLYSDH